MRKIVVELTIEGPVPLEKPESMGYLMAGIREATERCLRDNTVMREVSMGGMQARVYDGSWPQYIQELSGRVQFNRQLQALSMSGGAKENTREQGLEIQSVYDAAVQTEQVRITGLTPVTTDDAQIDVEELTAPDDGALKYHANEGD